MRKSKRGWWLAAIVAVGAVGAWRLGGGGFDDGVHPDSEAIVNQLWIDKLPRSGRDMIGHLMVLKRSGRRIGAVGRSSRWKHDVELFEWGLERSKLLLYFPQTRTKAERKVRYWKCEGEAPKPFELCLEIRGGPKTERYYSREDWVIDPDAAMASVAVIVNDEPALDGMLEIGDMSDTSAFTDASDGPL